MLRPNEIVYGLGLQLQSHIQRGLKNKLRVNADPRMDSGDSHAPVPFYVTTAGYGIHIDTARYATFYCGGKVRNGAPPEPAQPVQTYSRGRRCAPPSSATTSSQVVDPFPAWGLGMWYRVKGDFDQKATLALADEFRARRIPCDVLGLEPGWPLGARLHQSRLADPQAAHPPLR